MTSFDHLYAAEVLACARSLEQTAVVVRHRAALLAAASERCHWDGQGAWAFRTSAARTTTRMQRAAARADDAAAALRRHGAVVAAAVAEHDDERARATHHLADELGDVLHRLGVGR